MKVFFLIIIKGDNTTKDLLQTGFRIEEEPAVEKLYHKSHGFTRPGNFSFANE